MLAEAFITRYPFLYHMAEPGSWQSIQKRGLLSTSAVLDLFEITGAARAQYEERHRPDKVTLRHALHGDITLRDQKPLSDERLRACLEDGITPAQWYATLNSKVFFWVERERLLGLLGARAYRNDEHDVLTLDTRGLLSAHLARVWICHMNSGNTYPFPHKRGKETFRRLVDYPSRKNGNPTKEVVEFAVDYAVPDLARYTLRASRMRRTEVIATLFER